LYENISLPDDMLQEIPTLLIDSTLETILQDLQFFLYQVLREMRVFTLARSEISK